MALVLLLLFLILTSQSEWKQAKNELELAAAVSKQQQLSTKQEVIKEQIILSQEKKIYILNDLVKSLQQQLGQCQENIGENATNVAVGPQNQLIEIEEEG